MEDEPYDAPFVAFPLVIEKRKPPQTAVMTNETAIVAKQTPM
jgi:hypothetical protein